MMKSKYIWVFMVVIGFALISSNGITVQAEDYSYLVDQPPQFYELPGLNKKGNAVIEWTSMTDPSLDGVGTIYYEVQVAKNTSFTDAKQYITQESALTLSTSILGKMVADFMCVFAESWILWMRRCRIL